MANILIVRVSAIGDVIHTLPTVFYIKKNIKNSKISWVVQEKAAKLLVNQPFIDNLYVLPDKFLKLKNLGQFLKILKKIREEKFDAIIDFQGLTKTSLIISFLKGKKFGFDKENARESFSTFFTHRKTKPVYKNIIQKNLALTSEVLSHLVKEKKSCPTIEEIKKNFDFFIPEKNKFLIENWLIKNRIKKFITLCPNTTWESKHWPLENWKNLLDKNLLDIASLQNLDFVLIGRDFGDQAFELAKYIKNKNLKIFVAPKWDLSQVAYLVKKTDLLIAPDTGIFHLADFLGTDSIGFFGPTLAHRHGPFLTQKNIKNAIQVECPHLYKKSHDGANCMKKLSPEQLLKNVLSYINN